jgi:hypothetical protein
MAEPRNTQTTRKGWFEFEQSGGFSTALSALQRTVKWSRTGETMLLKLELALV